MKMNWQRFQEVVIGPSSMWSEVVCSATFGSSTPVPSVANCVTCAKGFVKAASMLCPNSPIKYSPQKE